MNKYLVIVLLSLLAGFVLSLFFFWWWNPKLIEPNISKEDLENIEVPNSEGFARINPDLKWKIPIDVGKCSRGDKRQVSNGMGVVTTIVLSSFGNMCVWKEHRSIEQGESFAICLIPKREKQFSVFDKRRGYCIYIPS